MTIVMLGDDDLKVLLDVCLTSDDALGIMVYLATEDAVLCCTYDPGDSAYVALVASSVVAVTSLLTHSSGPAMGAELDVYSVGCVSNRTADSLILTS